MNDGPQVPPVLDDEIKKETPTSTQPTSEAQADADKPANKPEEVKLESPALPTDDPFPPAKPKPDIQPEGPTMDDGPAPSTQAQPRINNPQQEIPAEVRRDNLFMDDDPSKSQPTQAQPGKDATPQAQEPAGVAPKDRAAAPAPAGQEKSGHVNHIAEAAKYNGDKAIDAKGLNDYAAHIGTGNTRQEKQQSGMDAIIKDIAGPDGKLTDEKIEKYLQESTSHTDLNDSRVTRGHDKGMIAARENLKDALRHNASPEMAATIPHRNSHAAEHQEYTQREAPTPGGKDNAKDVVANTPVTPEQVASALGAMISAVKGMGGDKALEAMATVLADALEKIAPKSAQPAAMEVQNAKGGDKTPNATAGESRQSSNERTV